MKNRKENEPPASQTESGEKSELKKLSFRGGIKTWFRPHLPHSPKKSLPGSMRNTGKASGGCYRGISYPPPPAAPTLKNPGKKRSGEGKGKDFFSGFRSTKAA